MAPTIRNKANPFFAKQNHVRLAKNQKTKGLVDVVSAIIQESLPEPPSGYRWELVTQNGVLVTRTDSPVYAFARI